MGGIMLATRHGPHGPAVALRRARRPGGLPGTSTGPGYRPDAWSGCRCCARRQAAVAYGHRNTGRDCRRCLYPTVSDTAGRTMTILIDAGNTRVKLGWVDTDGTRDRKS